MKKKDKVLVTIAVIAGIGLMFLFPNIERVTRYFESISSVETVTNVGFGMLMLILLAMIGYIGYAFFRMLRYEKKASAFRREIKFGDTVSIHPPQSHNLDGEVLNVDDEFVTVAVKVRKHLIYPEYKEKESVK